MSRSFIYVCLSFFFFLCVLAFLPLHDTGLLCDHVLGFGDEQVMREFTRIIHNTPSSLASGPKHLIPSLAQFDLVLHLPPPSRLNS